jgi:hypothetical protein
LVDEDEGDCGVCCLMWHLLYGESSSHETRRFVATFGSSRLKLGWYKYEFHHRSSHHPEGKWFDLDDCRSPYQIGSLLASQEDIAKIVRLHGIPKTIVSDRGSQFTAHFWEHLHKGLDTSLVRSTAYHPQIDGQTEWVNAILEDMLRACVLSSRGSWESRVPLAEFAYNNSYQESIKMAPFEALYGRKCRTPLN